MFIVFIRTAILYSLVVIVMSLMGKRQIDLAALPMQDTKFPLLLGIIPIITLLLMKTLLSQLQLKSQFARKIIDGEPTILIFKGKINFLGIKKQQINIDELMEEIRLSGYFDLNEIQYAILENNGQLSILPTSQSSSGGGTQKSDSDASVSTPAKKDSSSSSSHQEPMLPKILVMDGKVNKNALTTLGKDEEWVKKVLRNHNIHSIKDVLLDLYDTKGKFQYQLYDDYEKECSKCEIQ